MIQLALVFEKKGNRPQILFFNRILTIYACFYIDLLVIDYEIYGIKKSLFLSRIAIQRVFLCY
jgi:hypothetical protein